MENAALTTDIPYFGIMQMGSDNNNKYTGPERRVSDRRSGVDRRTVIRFGDVLGRRSGVDRRVSAR